MATMTLLEMRTHIRSLTLDRDSAMDDTTLNALINEAGNWWHTEYGDRVQRLPSASNALSYASSAWTDTSQTNYTKILGATLETSSSGVDTDQIDMIDPHDLYRLRLISTANGVPKYFSVFRNDIASFIGGWRVNIHPPSNITSYRVALMVETVWSDLSTDGSTPDVTQEDAYTLCRIAAWQAAYLLGRDRAMVEAIKSMLPQHIKSRLGMLERSLAPRPPVEHVG